MLITSIVYYCTLVFATVFYIKNRKEGNIGICDAIIISSWILCAFGGLFCSYGYASGSFQGFRPRVYACYLLYMVIVVLGFWAGKKIKIKLNLLNLKSCVIKRKTIWIFFCFIAIYSVLFFIFIHDNIPLIKLLKTGNVSDATISRMQTTHNIEDSYSLPFIFRYRKLIMETPLYLLLSISYVKYLRYRDNFFQFIIILLFTTFCHSFALEKSGVVNIAILMLFNYVLYAKIYKNKQAIKQTKKNITLVIIIFIILALIVLTYWLFMGQKSLSTIFRSIVQRLIMRQTGYIYYHDIILDTAYEGCLYGKEIPFFVLDSVLQRSTISLSSEAYSIVSSAYSSLGYTGTTGTMPMFFFVSNFGFIFGCLIFFILAGITAIIDKQMNKRLLFTNGSILSISVYTTIILLFYQAFISNLTTVYMLPFLFSPQLIMLWLCIKAIQIINR